MKQQIVCPSCKKPNIKNSHVKHSYKALTFAKNYCTNCDLVFWTPRTGVELQKLYEEDGETFSENMHVRHSSRIPPLDVYHRQWINEVRRLELPVLDFGCGSGNFVDFLSTQNISAIGVDFDKKSIENGKNNNVNNIFHISDIRQIRNIFHEKDIDLSSGLILTMFEVIEHLPEPLDLLTSLNQELPISHIFGSVPNRNRIKYFVNQSGDKPPYHFTQWSAKSLRVMLGNCDSKKTTISRIEHFYWYKQLTRSMLTSVIKSTKIEVFLVKLIRLAFIPLGLTIFVVDLFLGKSKHLGFHANLKK
jgi:SAM-dependent methyltransferase